MKKLQLLVAASVFMVANTALAARPGYTYVGAGFAKHNIDGCSQSGLYLEGGLSMDGQMFIQGRHVDVTSDSWCGSTSTELSLGFRNNFGNASTAYALVSLINRDYGPDSDAGLGLQIGIRSMYSPKMEVSAAAAYESIDSFDQLYVTGGIKYRLAPQFSLGGDISLNDEGNTGLSIGGRYSF